MAFQPVLPIVLTEDGGRRRTVTLSGADLPQEPHETDHRGTVRSHVRYYPGSSIPTAQVLGPEEGAIRFSGVFEDRRKGIPGWAMQQATLLDQIRRASYPVYYEYGPIRRRCLWAEFSFKIEEPERIPYMVELQVIDHGLGGERERVFSQVLDLPVVSGALSAIAEVQGILDVLPPGVGGEFLARAQGYLGRATAAVGTASSILDTIAVVGRAARPGLAAQAATSLQGARASLRDAFETVRRLEWAEAAGAAFDLATDVARQTAGALVGVVRSALAVDRVLPRVQALAGAAGRELVHISTDGETLQKIAQRYYGDAAAWTRIADANGRRNGEVAAGEVLVIPDTPRADKQAPAP